MISGGGIRSRFDDASGLDGSIEPNASAPAPAADNVSFSRNNDAMEPVLASIQDARLERRKLGPYYARTNEQVKVALGRLLEANGLSGQSIGGIARMQGGASKEQFVFEMDDPVSAGRERFILRMDPRAGIVETCRRREAEIVRAIAGVVPCPETVYLDAEGEHLGQPGLVARFVPGVTRS